MQWRGVGMRRCLIVCLLLAACGMKQPESKRVRKTVASWDASLALTATSWSKGDLPKHFVKNAAEAAVEELSKSAYGHAAAHALALANDLKEAAEHDDKAAASRISQALERDAKALQ
jgi:hypothetical protein